MKATTQFFITSVVLWMMAIIVWQFKDLADEEARHRQEADMEALAGADGPDPGTRSGLASDGWGPAGEGLLPMVRPDYVVRPAPPLQEGSSAPFTHHLSPLAK